MSKRKNHPTSIDAFRQLDPEKISQTHQKIINALALISKGHYEDIAAKAKINPSSCWKRLSEVREKGLIERTTERKNLSSGSQGSVWKLTEKGRQAVTEGILPGKSVADFARALIQPSPSQYIQERLF